MDAGGSSERTLKEIGKDVAKWRKEHGYTQEKFASAVGITKKNIEKLEQGIRMPDWDEVYWLKNFMGMDDDFFATSVMMKKRKKTILSLDYRVELFVSKLLQWHHSTEYSMEKDDDLKQLEVALNNIDDKYKLKRLIKKRNRKMNSEEPV